LCQMVTVISAGPGVTGRPGAGAVLVSPAGPLSGVSGPPAGPSGPGWFPGAVPGCGPVPGGTSFSPGTVSLNR
jgi:hypothetical protein